MSGRREAQVMADARVMGQSSYIYEAGCGVNIDFEPTLLVGDWEPKADDDPTPAQRMLDAGHPRPAVRPLRRPARVARPLAHRPPPLAPVPREGRRGRGERAAHGARVRGRPLPRQRRDRPPDGGGRGPGPRLPPGARRRLEGEGRRLPRPGPRLRRGELHRESATRSRTSTSAASVGRFFWSPTAPSATPACARRCRDSRTSRSPRVAMGDGFYEAVVSTLAERLALVAARRARWPRGRGASSRR